MPYHPIEIPAARKRPSRLLYENRWHECQIDEWDMTSEGIKLRAIRQGTEPQTNKDPKRLIPLRAFATRLGMQPSLLSGLETGRYTLTPEEWATLFVQAERAAGIVTKGE